MPSHAVVHPTPSGVQHAKPGPAGPTAWSKQAGWIRYAMMVPVLNLFVQVMYVGPSYDTTVNLLSTLGLISALVLAVVLSLPGTVNYEELIAADRRFGIPAGNPDADEDLAKWWRDTWSIRGAYSPSFLFGANLSVSTWLLTVALLAIVVQYVFLGNAKAMADNAKAQGADMDELEFMRLYHKYNRWVFVADICAIGGGIGLFFMTLYYMVIIKWPDYLLMKMDTGGEKPTHVYRSVFVLVFLVPVFVFTLAALSGHSQYAIYMSAKAKLEAKAAPAATAAGGGDVETPDTKQ